MKKLLSFILILALILTAACNRNPNNNNGTNNVENTKNEKLTIKDYYPFKENNKYVYEGKGNEYAAYTVFTDYISDDRVQLRINNGGTEIVRVLENKGGQLTQLLSRGETYFRDNFTGTANSDGEILLKEPLVKGTSWNTGDNIKRTITNVDMEITTPLGSYKAIEVTAEGAGYKTLEYYAQDVGLIKSVTSENDNEVSSTLSKIETDASFVQGIRIFYPNMEEDVLNFTIVDCSFKTNDETKDVLEKTIKNLARENQVLTPNAKINSLHLQDNETVNIDFSKELITEMNAGSSYEAMILQSITNTLGTYYNVENVYITVEGAPYESGHIMLEENEPFKVDLENVKEAE